MTAKRASGTFEIQMTPRTLESEAGEKGVSAFSFDKQFQGDLDGVSLGEMLAFRSEVEGSAGYVAVEHVTGTLDGRSGSFVLQHSSSMDRGAPKKSVSVIPDSGTGELEGLEGQLTINIADGQHSYDFDYVITSNES